MTLIFFYYLSEGSYLPHSDLLNNALSCTRQKSRFLAVINKAGTSIGSAFVACYIFDILYGHFTIWLKKDEFHPA